MNQARIGPWEVLALVSFGLLTLAGWILHPSLGLAILGMLLLATAILGSRAEVITAARAHALKAREPKRNDQETVV